MQPDNAEKQLNLSNGAFFRDKRRERTKKEIVELPSGAVVEMSRPDTVKMLREGKIPASVAVSVQNIAKNGEVDLTGEHFKDYLKTLDVVVCASIVTPEVRQGEVSEEDYAKNIISVDDIELKDKEFVFAYAEGGSKDLSQFRDQE